MSDPNRTPDEYERRFMSADGDVLFRDRAVVPRAFLGFLGAVGVGIAALAAIVPEAWPAALIGLPTLGFTAAFMMALRTAVTTDVVHIQYGVIGPRIPIEAIERCQAIDYKLWQVGGWGIRLTLDGTTVYNMMGDGQRAAEIVYRDGKKTKRVLVSVKDLDGFVAAVNAARSRKATATSSATLTEARERSGLARAPAPDPVSQVEHVEQAEAPARR